DPIGVDVSAIALGVTDPSPPVAAVGGITDPAAGTLSLAVRATDSGLGLSSAAASVDGTPTSTVDIGGAGCAPLSGGAEGPVNLALGASCPSVADNVTLTVPTTSLPDGPHHLVVTVRDAAGNVATVADQTITVRNTLPVTQSSTTLTVGTGSTDTGGGG